MHGPPPLEVVADLAFVGTRSYVEGLNRLSEIRVIVRPQDWTVVEVDMPERGVTATYSASRGFEATGVLRLVEETPLAAEPEPAITPAERVLLRLLDSCDVVVWPDGCIAITDAGWNDTLPPDEIAAVEALVEKSNVEDRS